MAIYQKKKGFRFPFIDNQSVSERNACQRNIIKVNHKGVRRIECEKNDEKSSGL